MTGKTSTDKLDQIVSANRRYQDQRANSYRERALNLYSWICGRCGREFDRLNITELTVHHRDHDHDHNPADGSNWELLCLYCHDNEHQRQLSAHFAGEEQKPGPGATSNPFAGLRDMLNKKPE